MKGLISWRIESNQVGGKGFWIRLLFFNKENDLWLVTHSLWDGTLWYSTLMHNGHVYLDEEMELLWNQWYTTMNPGNGLYDLTSDYLGLARPELQSAQLVSEAAVGARVEKFEPPPPVIALPADGAGSSNDSVIIEPQLPTRTFTIDPVRPRRFRVAEVRFAVLQRLQ